tara:strand:- start:2637 stop:3215 length:579 start_codon:yes stop_codon:yes gene_type:complete
MLNRFLVLLLLCSPQVQAQNNWASQLSKAALELTKDDVVYDPSYYQIPYPNGDVPADRGVCTDVVVRAYRKLGVDLQKLVHEDMVANFKLYPQKWQLKGPDSNIDHRRVPNLMKFFSRKGQTLSLSQSSKDYKAGDIVCWDLGGGILHIGLVVDRLSADGTPMIVHNIGSGQVLADCLFQFTIIGHYRYSGQ